MTMGPMRVVSCLVMVAMAGCKAEGQKAGAGSDGTAGVEGTDGGPAQDGRGAAGDLSPAAETVPVPGPGGMLDVRIIDSTTGKLAEARVNVIGSDHAYYEPTQTSNPLYRFSLKRWGNRQDFGPGRYNGSFFYTDGTFQISLPPGPARIEVRKGYAYYQAIFEATVAAERKTSADVTLRPMIDMPKGGWYSTDTHIHFERPDLGDTRLVKLLAAEDVNFANSMSWNSDANIASFPRMMPQPGYGPKTIQTWGAYSLVSGHEHIASPLGHVTELMMTALPADSDQNRDVHRGPSLARIYDEIVKLGGAMGHNHGGQNREALSDVVLGKSDWVELLQFGIYRGIGLGPTGGRYYDTLNTGFRYALAGASDYPFCRTLSDTRSYVMGGPRATFESITGSLIRGEAFATSGPLLFVSVDDRGPGDQIDVAGSGPRRVVVKVNAISSYLPIDKLEIVVNGQVPPEGAFPQPTPTLSAKGEAMITLNASSWIAARCQGPQDVRAHTNPIWIYFNNQAPFIQNAGDALKQSIEEFNPGSVGSDVMKDLTDAKTEIARLAGTQNHPVGRIPNFPRDSSMVPGMTGGVLIPPVLARPAAPPAATIEGLVVDEKGKPVSGAMVSARGQGLAVATRSTGAFTLPAVAVEEALFLRVSKMGFVTTNSSYLNPRCRGTCLKIVCMTSAYANDLMASRPPTSPPGAWVAFNVLDDKGMPKAGIAPEAFPAHDGANVNVSWDGKLGYLATDGKFGGTATVSNPGGGIQAFGAVPINFRDSEDKDREPNVIISVPALGKDLVLPVFGGQVSYGVMTEGLSGM